ncbi:proteasome 26S non-ATPase subunit 3 [Salpingoeca rosetta]|uniref:Proteasome 26S non-ATPase subunit 3 n=1 Tax=Salpingoeca rosetta (strain ATCC 50818 / BSB-021) TaxID=946362 RepID=F2U2M6_SALR5|nr:proteasome 26S non-ATPase subunit 3 [Salpingoeca rosetta]EGD81381.1 proteasome 26S non-ATPase subunit 3 [Salpingoeca rosetta]|eukprot:XP_004996585.1 proteasome 26S non-ATPase subunit 3 [Salpingoeca rosetta]
MAKTKEDKAEKKVEKEEKKEELTEEQKAENAMKLLAKDIVDAALLVWKAVSERDVRFAARALRRVTSLRARLSPQAIASATQQLVAEGEERSTIISLLGQPESMDEGEDDTKQSQSVVQGEGVHEVAMYLRLLVALYFLRETDLDKSKDILEALVADIDKSDHREASPLFATVFYFYTRIYELRGQAWDIKTTLHAALRVHTLRQNVPTQAVLINALLRLYLNADLVDQAELLVSKVTFPETAPNNETARFLYYLGRIKAVQLEYTEADHCLLQAARKAPAGAIGFKQHVHKLHVIVKMLLGEIPERDLFREPHLKRPLEPYFKLTHAVRLGEVGTFSRVVQEHRAKFCADKTFKLILRLRQSVIKAGIKTISFSYSRISLADLAKKLGLDSALDAEYVVAKAIKDGVIDATIDHSAGTVTSKEVVDVYSTNEPQEAFHRRIAFCLKLHNESVKAMRYPPNAHKKYLQANQVMDEEEEVVDSGEEEL